MIYFAQAGERRGPVKIGHSSDPQGRLKNIQPGNAEKLFLVAELPGGRAHERSLHRRFAAGRMRGEWFREDTPGLQDFLSDAIHFQGFWPDDRTSPCVLDMLAFYRDVEQQLGATA